MTGILRCNFPSIINYIYQFNICTIPSDKRPRPTPKYFGLLEDCRVETVLQKRFLGVGFVVAWGRIEVFVVSSSAFA